MFILISTSIRDLGDTFNSTLSFAEYICNLSRPSCHTFFEVSVSVPFYTFSSMTHSCVSSRIDYCNSLPLIFRNSRLSTLHSVLKAPTNLPLSSLHALTLTSADCQHLAITFFSVDFVSVFESLSFLLPNPSSFSCLTSPHPVRYTESCVYHPLYFPLRLAL